MSHYIYLYGNNTTTHNKAEDTLLEAKYELPLCFVPLLAGNPRRVGREIYAEAAPGLAALREFHALIDRHAGRLIGDADACAAWRAASARILGYFEGFDTRYFELEMRDVFAMSERAPKEQADTVLENLKTLAGFAEQAARADSPDLLDLMTMHGSFKDYLSDLREVGYGLEYLWDEDEGPAEARFPERFEAQGRFGLKKDGRVIAEPIYRAIYDFEPASGLAVAQIEDESFCYLNRQGQREFPATFDDAYDFFTASDAQPYAIAKSSGRCGLLNRQGGWALSPGYADLVMMHDDGRLLAFECEGQWGVITLNGQVIVPPRLPFAPRPNNDYTADFYTCAPEGETAQPVCYLTRAWQEFTLPAGQSVEESDTDGHVLIRAGKRHGLISVDGRLLLEACYDALRFDHALHLYRVQQKGKHGVFDARDSNWILPCEYQAILSHHDEGYQTADFVLPVFAVCQGRRHGVFHFAERRWIIPCSQAGVRLFAHALGVMPEKTEPPAWWVCDLNQGQRLAGPYRSLSDLKGLVRFACVLGFTEEAIYTVGADGSAYPLDEAAAGEYLDYAPQSLGSTAYLTHEQGSAVKRAAPVETRSRPLIDDAWRAYQRGRIDTAITLLETAIAQGSVDAKVDLGLILDDTAAGSHYDPTRALSLYEAAAAAGNPFGMNNLGDCYRMGRNGYAVDLPRAIALFLAAADKNPMAARNLAEIYYDEPAFTDLALARDYFLKAWPEYPRPLEIAYCYDRLGDLKQALKYYEIAGKKGEGYALNRIGSMWRDGELGTVSLTEARKYYEHAMRAEQASGEAGLNLARLLLETGCQKDRQAARAAWQFAQQHDHAQALSEGADLLAAFAPPE